MYTTLRKKPQTPTFSFSIDHFPQSAVPSEKQLLKWGMKEYMEEMPSLLNNDAGGKYEGYPS